MNVKMTATKSRFLKRWPKTAPKMTMNIGSGKLQDYRVCGGRELIGRYKGDINKPQQHSGNYRAAVYAYSVAFYAYVCKHRQSAKKLRRADITNEFQGMSFINIPAMLQSAAHISISRIALFSFFIYFSVYSE